MNFLLYALLFVFGLGIGSFINVVSLRYNPERNFLSPFVIGGRSRCPHCSKTLAWYELVPIFSFFFQLGKCRNCRQKISWQYPIVEILSGLIFVFVPLQVLKNLSLISGGFWEAGIYGLTSAILWAFIFELFLLLSIIDFRQMLIPDGVNLFLAALGSGLVVIRAYYHKFGDLEGSFLKNYAILAGLRENIFINHLLAAAFAMLFFGLIIIISRGRGMGWGDFKLVGSLGVIFGWPDIILVVSLAFVIGSIFGIILMTGGRKKMKDAVPFGPFLVLASALIFFFGYEMLAGYFKLFS